VRDYHGLPNVRIATTRIEFRIGEAESDPGRLASWSIARKILNLKRNEPCWIRTNDPLLKRPFRRLGKIQCLRGSSLSSNDFADARLSEVFTRDHGFSFLYRYKNRYKVSTGSDGRRRIRSPTAVWWSTHE